MMGSFSVLSWSAGAELLNKILGFELKDISKLTIKNIPFVYFNEMIGWESLSDEELFNKIINEGKDCFDVTRNVFAVTDVSYLSGDGVFVFKGEQSGDFFQEYFENFDECFFNGDVFFIFPESNRLVLFQHDGFLIFYETPIECF